jgi:hypothetical protein
MAQVSSFSVGNVAGATFRSLINGIVAALQSCSAGASAPTSTAAGMLWLDTSVSPAVLKQRNSANDAWRVVITAAAELGGDPVGTTGTQTLSGKTITNLVLDGKVTEEVFAVTGTTPALSPANGTLQTWTLSGNSTPTDGLSAGESLTMMIDDGTAFAITWPTMQWAGGAAPTLAASGYSVVTLWKVGATLYGAAAGDMS